MSEDPTHIRLVCWDDAQHVQVISEEQLRAIIVAPICTAKVEGRPFGLCGAAIWAVEHKGEPTRYVGRPPNRNWQGWADCIPVA